MFGLVLLVLILPGYLIYSLIYLSKRRLQKSIINVFLFVFSGYLIGITSCIAMFATWALIGGNFDSMSNSYALVFFAIMGGSAYLAVWSSGFVVEKYNKSLKGAP